MAKKKPDEIVDVEECAEKIRLLLREYNCELWDCDEGRCVRLRDCDTDETVNVVY